MRVLPSFAIGLFVMHAPAAHAGHPPFGGAARCDLVIDPVLAPLPTVPVEVERDRMQMSGSPAASDLIYKAVPLGVREDGLIQSGGDYAFPTELDAERYLEETIQAYSLDGVPFLDRPYFVAHECHAWRVVGAADFSGFRSYTEMAFVRWAVPHGAPWLDLLTDVYLAVVWPALRAHAACAGLDGIKLYRGPGRVEVVLYGDVNSYDVGWLAPRTWSKEFDSRDVVAGDLFVFTIWLPFAMGDSGEPSIWPQAFLPGLSCGDGLCVPSASEDATTCELDCSSTCGDAVCDEAESIAACPSDCVWF